MGVLTEDPLAETPKIESLLCTRDAAKILNVSEAWLERKRWEGAGPPRIRVGGPTGRAVRYRASDLLAWIETNRIDDDDR
jgi:predicted DNA-binding transcriptional regulator AlpA